MTFEGGHSLMKALNVVVLIVGLLGGLAGLGSILVVTSERISTKDEVLAIKDEGLAMNASVRKALRALAECVDTPEYVGKSDRAERDPSCEFRVLEVLEEMRNR